MASTTLSAFLKSYHGSELRLRRDGITTCVELRHTFDETSVLTMTEKELAILITALMSDVVSLGDAEDFLGDEARDAALSINVVTGIICAVHSARDEYV